MGFSAPNPRKHDPDVNLQNRVKYLAGACLVAGGNQQATTTGYAHGDCTEAGRKGLPREAGLV